MLKFICVLLFFSFSNLTADDVLYPVPESIKKESLLLQGESNFIVYYAFEDKDLEKNLKEIMVIALEKIGTVYSGEEAKLSEKMKEDRSKKGGMIEVVLSSLIEENPQDSLKYTKLPVMQLSFKALSDGGMLKNGSKQCCVLWEREKFLATSPKKKELNDKITKTFQSMMSEFIQWYKQANPTSKKDEVQFFLYA